MVRTFEARFDGAVPDGPRLEHQERREGVGAIGKLADVRAALTAGADHGTGQRTSSSVPKTTSLRGSRPTTSILYTEIMVAQSMKKTAKVPLITR